MGQRQVLLALLMLAATPLLQARPPVIISGRVITSGKDTPLAGATVSLYAMDGTDPLVITQSLSNGSYILRAPAPGKYRLSLFQKDCDPFEKVIEVPPGGLSLELPMQRHPMLEIRLRGNRGQLVPPGPVQLSVLISWKSGSGGVATLNKEIANDGLLSVPMLPYISLEHVEKVVIAVRHAAAGCGEMELDSFPEEPVTLRLRPGSSLRGVVMDSGGKPAAGAAVAVNRVFHEGSLVLTASQGMVTTGADGSFEADQLLEGAYQLKVKLPDNTSFARTIEIDQPLKEVALSPGRG